MGTAVTLALKIRRDPEFLVIPRKAVERLLEQDGTTPGYLAEALGKSLKDAPVSSGTHDKSHLELVAHWRPEGGLPAAQDAKWLGLRTRVANLDDTREGDFTINQAQAQLLWERLKDERFKVGNPTQAWSAFLRDYLLATGNVFGDVTAELLDTGDPGT